jgi:hypothetical protein
MGCTAKFNNGGVLVADEEKLHIYHIRCLTGDGVDYRIEAHRMVHDEVSVYFVRDGRVVGSFPRAFTCAMDVTDSFSVPSGMQVANA